MKKVLIFTFSILIIFNLNVLAKKRMSKPEQWVNSQIYKTLEPLSKKSEALTVFSKTEISANGDYLNLSHKVVYKILKTTALNYGQLTILSNTRSKVYDIKGWRFNSSGKQLESLDKDKIKERAYNLSFYDDSKQYIASFKNIEKGDIVAFEYKEKLHRYFRDFSVTLGNSIDTLYEEVTINGSPKISIYNDNLNIVKQNGNTYFVENFKKLKDEKYTVPDRDRLPLLLITYDVEKNSSWDSFGKDFIKKTNRALNLNEATKSDLSKLFSITDEKEFIEKTVKQVSHNINYVDVEFGTGGFIPRECNFVHSKKYGDCKDMAYYATAILRAKGIKAFPVLARTKEIGKVYKDFVSDQFNHVIMAVKLNEKTKELENIKIDGVPYLITDLTDRFTPIPLLSSSIEGTYGLILDESGSKLVKIPYSNPEKNKITYDLKVNFDYNRNIDVYMTETKIGQYYASEKSFLESLKENKKHEKYESWIQDFVPGSRLKTFDYNYDNDCVITDVNFIAPKSGIEAGEEIYFIPNLIDANKKSYKRKPRVSTLKFTRLFTKEINICSTISRDFKIVSIPKAINFENDFFKFTLKSTQKENIVTYNSKITWKVTEVLPEDYKIFRKEYKKYLKSLKAPIVLKKN